jgi:hypothetical protein
MPQACWQAAADGPYWIDIALESQDFRLLIDLGLIDAHNRVGFSIDPTLYDHLNQSGQFVGHLLHSRLDANGRISLTESGSLDAQLIHPVSRQRIGPVVHLHVFRGASGVPNRVGLAFFHNLVGCKVL